MFLFFRSASFKDTLLNDIRKAREKYQGEELAKELSRIKLRIDNTEVLTQDIVMNLLFSYRDIQVPGDDSSGAYREGLGESRVSPGLHPRGLCLCFDKQDYDAMVKLVQTLEMLPTCDLATQPMIQFHFAFALNRCRRRGNA